VAKLDESSSGTSVTNERAVPSEAAGPTGSAYTNPAHPERRRCLMSESEKLGLFLVTVGLGLLATKASQKLARETGFPALLISVLAGAVGHGIAREL
jgi:hypothetical protein